jgi:hypothetical protein
MTPADRRRAGGLVVVELRGPIAEHQAKQLCGRVEAQILRGAPREIRCDIRGTADLSVVDALARLALIAQRFDGSLDVRSAGDDLAALLVLTGLEVIIAKRLEPRGQPEACE